MNSPKKILSSILFTLVLVVIVTIVISRGSQETLANPSTIGWSYLGGIGNIATSSLTYMTPATATSTVIINVDGSDQADANILLLASSSATDLNFYIDFSDDLNCDQASTSAAGGFFLPTAYISNCNWFRESTNSVVGTSILESSTTIHEWTPAATTTVNWATKNISVTNIAAKFMRISFGLTKNNGGVWAQVVSKKQRP